MTVGSPSFVHKSTSTMSLIGFRAERAEVLHDVWGTRVLEDARDRQHHELVSRGYLEQ